MSFSTRLNPHSTRFTASSLPQSHSCGEDQRKEAPCPDTAGIFTVLFFVQHYYAFLFSHFASLPSSPLFALFTKLTQSPGVCSVVTNASDGKATAFHDVLYHRGSSFRIYAAENQFSIMLFVTEYFFYSSRFRVVSLARHRLTNLDEHCTFFCFRRFRARGAAARTGTILDASHDL
jgi:hypothetical protein